VSELAAQSPRFKDQNIVKKLRHAERTGNRVLNLLFCGTTKTDMRCLVP